MEWSVLLTAQVSFAYQNFSMWYKKQKKFAGVNKHLLCSVCGLLSHETLRTEFLLQLKEFTQFKTAQQRMEVQRQHVKVVNLALVMNRKIKLLGYNFYYFRANVCNGQSVQLGVYKNFSPINRKILLGHLLPFTSTLYNCSFGKLPLCD